MFTGNQEIIFVREEWGLSINFKLIFRLIGEISILNYFCKRRMGVNYQFQSYF